MWEACALCRQQAGGVTIRLCMGNMLETGMATWIVWVSGMLYNQEEFDPKENWSTEDLYPSACATCSSNIFNLFLALPLHSFWVTKKADYVWYMSVVVFLRYTTHQLPTGMDAFHNLNCFSHVEDRSRGQPKGSLFNSYYTKMWGRALLLSLDCSTLLLIHTL